MVIPNECVVGCAYRDCTSETHSEFCPCDPKVLITFPDCAVDSVERFPIGGFATLASGPFPITFSVDNREVLRITADAELVFAEHIRSPQMAAEAIEECFHDLISERVERRVAERLEALKPRKAAPAKIEGVYNCTPYRFFIGDKEFQTMGEAYQAAQDGDMIRSEGIHPWSSWIEKSPKNRAE